jgi:hypothetical protein
LRILIEQLFTARKIVKPSIGLSMGTTAGLAKSSFGALSGRYSDAYNISARIVRCGTFVKFASLVLPGAAALIEIWRLSVQYDSWLSYHWHDDLLFLLFGACAVSAVGYLGGMLVSALGQLIGAILDTAVNTSPHLQQSEKASIMGL